jgi:DNA-binding LacI/PurR family transcriptional regulator
MDVKEQMLKDILYGKKADAVILITHMPGPKTLREFKKQEIPVVLIENSAPGVSTVKIDNYNGAFAATEYLVKKGRKKIAIINGPIKVNDCDEEENPVFSDRLRGYKDALEDYRMKFRESLSFNVAHFNQDEGMRIMGIIRDSKQEIDAIFCPAGDIVALGIIYECRKSGIRIPEDVALVGYDDIPVAGIMNPSLTTIRQPMYGMGKAAFDLVKSALEDKTKKNKEVILIPELIIRESA